VCFVVIDGIRDLISNINSEDEATEISSHLLRWTLERNIHILNVLHENKGSDFARGHIGTELENKSETLFAVNLVEGDKQTSVVESKRVRGGDFSPMYFTIENEDNPDYSFRLPRFIDDYTPPSTANGREVKITNPAELPDKAHDKILSDSFKEQKQQSYNELWKTLKMSLKAYGNPIGDNHCKQWITWYYENDMITCKKDGRKSVYSNNKEVPF